MSQRLLRVFIAAVVIVSAERASATIDITGDWHVLVDNSAYTYPYVVDVRIDQTGGTFAVSFSPPSPLYTGTIDINTGAFSFGGPFCPGAPNDHFTGVAAGDGNSFTATGTIYFEQYPGGPCGPFTLQLTGAREPCGDGTLDAGEECDDGNNLPNDCCSTICKFEPVQSLCSDGNSLTCERCDGAGTCQPETCPPLDLTGPWVSANPFVLCLDFTQTGSTLYASYCGSTPYANFSGTIDLFTGHFVITQPPNACYLVEPQYCQLDATAALNGLSWSGTYECSEPVFPQPPGGGGCSFDSIAVSASRGVCGDGYSHQASGEQCDDGNVVGGDCCSATCQLEAAGSTCSDGNPATCDACDGYGTCVLTTCPAVLDHYKCYQGADVTSPSFSPTNANTNDQLGSEPVTVQKLKYVCAPVDKNGEGINDPAAHVACYQIKGADLAPRPQVDLSTQFQASQLELRKPKLLCVPGTKTALP